MRAVLDTNILVDYLNGVEDAARELARYDDPLISRITWMETLAGAWGTAVESPTIAFLERFSVIDIDELLARKAVEIRSQRRIKLPGAIIWATAKTQGCLIVTRNRRDFDEAAPEVRIPYSV